IAERRSFAARAVSSDLWLQLAAVSLRAPGSAVDSPGRQSRACDAERRGLESWRRHSGLHSRALGAGFVQRQERVEGRRRRTEIAINGVVRACRTRLARVADPARATTGGC